MRSRNSRLRITSIKPRISLGTLTIKHGILGTVDAGVRTFKHVYGALAPVLESHGGSPGRKHVMKALTGYDTIKGQVTEGHDGVMKDVNNVKGRLAQKNVRFDFT